VTVSFLSPWFLVGALAVAVPILLHLRRKDVAPPHEFSAVRFLRRAPVEQRRPRHLKDLLLLLLRAAAVILLAVAFARPYIVGDAATSKTTVIALDTSFSMAAPGRFDRAREAAQKAVASVPSGDRVAVVRFDDHATLVAPPSLDRGAARAAIGSQSPGYGATEYEAALATAARALGPEGGRVVVVTDLQEGGFRSASIGALPENVELAVEDVGGGLENLSVGQLTVNGDSIVARVANHGVKPRAASVSLWLNDRSVAETSSTINPGASAVQLMARLPSSGIVRVSVVDPEGPAADNDRFLVLDPPPAPAVLLLGEEPTGEDLFYLRAAVESADVPRRVALEVLSGSQRNALTAATARERQVIGLVGTRGLERQTRAALAEYLRDGGALFIAAGPTLDAGTFGEIVGGRSSVRIEGAGAGEFPTSLAPVDARHPIFAAFGDAASNLGEAQFTSAVRLVPGEGGRTLARFTNALPALVEQPVGTGRLLLFASDLSGAWNTFPRQSSFVPFVLEALRYLSRLRTLPSELTVADVPAGVAPKPGMARIGAPPRPVAINVDLRESSTSRVSAERFIGAVRRVPAETRAADAHAREREASQHLWRFVLMAVGLFLLAEGLLGHRAPRGGQPVAVSLSEGIGVQR
jgi:hypothetical protein